MNSKHETNSKKKRSLTADYIARNVEDPDSDLSHDGSPRPEFKEDPEPITEPDGKKRKEEEDESDDSEGARGTCEKKLKDHHGKERPIFHGSSSDEESSKKTNGETSNK